VTTTETTGLAIRKDTSNNDGFVFKVNTSNGNLRFNMRAVGNNGQWNFGEYGNDNVSLSTDEWHIYLMSLRNAGGSVDYSVYQDGVQVSSTTAWIVDGSTSDNGIDVNGNRFRVGGPLTGNNAYGSEIGMVYFAGGYVDFTQEANRNLFVDQLGYPKDLTPLIDDGNIPTPAIYMKFDDTSALGTNSGTGSDTQEGGGTVTAGSDVDPNA
jgi:hypothetical protein